MDEPKIIDCSRFIDDRGVLDAVVSFEDPILKHPPKMTSDQPDDIDFKIKRMYVTTNQKGVIRAFHGHKNESKIFYCVNGAIKVLAFSMAARHSKPADLKTFVLNDMKPQTLFIPSGWYHGYVTLNDESRVIILSDKSTEESQKDDYRIPALEFGSTIWEVRHR